LKEKEVEGTSTVTTKTSSVVTNVTEAVTEEVVRQFKSLSSAHNGSTHNGTLDIDNSTRPPDDQQGVTQAQLDAIWACVVIVILLVTLWLLFKCCKRRQRGGFVDEQLDRLQAIFCEVGVDFMGETMRTMTGSLSQFLSQRFR
jgi:hypothetical protein